MFKEMPILTSITVILILIIAFVLIDCIASKPEPFYGSVMDNHYKAERNGISSGNGMTNNGKNGVVITSDHESEKFLLMVKTEAGNIVTVQCKAELYYKKQVGERIDCKAFKGFFTGSIYSMYGVR